MSNNIRRFDSYRLAVGEPSSLGRQSHGGASAIPVLPELNDESEYHHNKVVKNKMERERQASLDTEEQTVEGSVDTLRTSTLTDDHHHYDDVPVLQSDVDLVSEPSVTDILVENVDQFSSIKRKLNNVLAGSSINNPPSIIGIQISPPQPQSDTASEQFTDDSEFNDFTDEEDEDVTYDEEVPFAEPPHDDPEAADEDFLADTQSGDYKILEPPTAKGSSESGTLESNIYEPISFQGDSQEESTAAERNLMGFSFKKSKSKSRKGRHTTTASFSYNHDKHPAPRLPDRPDGLTENQIKRRHVISNIVDTENSYVDSLLRLKELYKAAWKEQKLIPDDKIQLIFYKIDEILECHLIFRIALEDSINQWDEKELIGAYYQNGFSKLMVAERYTQFIVNFLTATETYRKMLLEKPQFKAFVMRQAKESPDKMDPLGLMIKVIQRFPQLRLQLMDLLKYTGPEHPDYTSLNQAFTTVENLAFQLNEKKRDKELKLAGRQLLAKLGIKNTDTTLVRQDDISELSYGSGGDVSTQRNRRILLFNDLICCVKLESQSNGEEKFSLKWCYPISKVEYEETGSRREPKFSSSRGGTVIQAQAHTTATDQPVNTAAANSSKQLHREVGDLRHDELVLGKVQLLVNSLKQTYKGLDASIIKEHLQTVLTTLKIRQQQLQMFDTCNITLTIGGNDTMGKNRNELTVQMRSPQLKQDWILDFRALKLGQEEVNKNCWSGETEMLRPPLLIRNMDVNVTGANTTVRCATTVFLSSPSSGVGLQYLWVCTSKQGQGQVTLVSLHSNVPHSLQTFQACDGEIECCCLVPSSIHSSLDHVWMSTSDNRIHVFGLSDKDRSKVKRSFTVNAAVRDMCCVENHVFVGLENGMLMKYAKRKEYQHHRQEESSPLYEEPMLRQFNRQPINSIVNLSNNKILIGCGNTFHVISTTKQLAILESVPIDDAKLEINKVIALGKGFWFSCSHDPVIRLVHAENLHTPMQEINIGAAVSKMQESNIGSDKDVHVTCLASSRGLLWVGVSTGHILTIPMPVLDGIPLSAGRISLCSQKHLGPVMFIIPIKCSLTFAPRLVDEIADEFVDSDSPKLSSNQSSLDSLSHEATSSTETLQAVKQNPVKRIKEKVKSQISSWGGSAENLSKRGARSSVTFSTSNPVPRRPYGAPQSEMFGSLMRLDIIDENRSASELLQSLVPANVHPTEKVFTVSQICSNKDGGLRVVKSSSIANLTASNLQEFRNQPQSKAQSMMALDTPDSGPIRRPSIFKPKSDKLESRNNNDVVSNLDLKTRIGSLQRRKHIGSMGSLLSDLAEDDEETRFEDSFSMNRLTSGDEPDRASLAALEESEEFLNSLSDSDVDDEFLDEESEEFEEEVQACVETNYLKATIIVSGGQGSHNPICDIYRSDDAPNLILWQQNQTG